MGQTSRGRVAPVAAAGDAGSAIGLALLNVRRKYSAGADLRQPEVNEPDRVQLGDWP